MDNFGFLQRYERLQETIMFDKFIDLGFTVVSYCAGDNSAFWNHALINQFISEDQLEKIAETMRGLERNPALYFENRQDLYPLIDFLKTRGYGKGFEDSWMFHSGENIDKSQFGSVKKVIDETDLKIFLKVFEACYQKDDPQNAYGELGNYLKMAKESWHRHHETNRIEYFMIYKGSRPVAVSALTNYNNIGYISNVGSLKEVRGQGFGKLATLYCVNQSKKRGNTEHCLATEEGTYVNEFYKRVGFKTLFTALGYVKKV